MPFAHRSRKCKRLDRMVVREKRRTGKLPPPHQGKTATFAAAPSEAKPEPAYLPESTTVH